MKKQYFINANIIDPYNSLNENGGLIVGEDGKIEAIGKKVNTNNLPTREKPIYLKGKYIFDNSLLYWAFFILWSMYGVLYMMDEKTKNVGFNILDLFAKCFVGIFFWAYSKHSKSKFDEAANLVFADDDKPTTSQDSGEQK